jgi:hypothetical protein
MKADERAGDAVFRLAVVGGTGRYGVMLLMAGSRRGWLIAEGFATAREARAARAEMLRAIRRTAGCHPLDAVGEIIAERIREGGAP